MPSITRRQLLAGAAGASALGAAAYAAHTVFAPTHRTTTATRPGAPRSPASAASPATRATLVLVTLYGGNDGLNTGGPYADPAYEAARPALAVTDAIHLDGALGLHPSLTGLKRLWDAGHLAI